MDLVCFFLILGEYCYDLIFKEDMIGNNCNVICRIRVSYHSERKRKRIL